MTEPRAVVSTRVLVVEDDPVVRRLLRIRLCRAGFAVVEASTGEEALGIARTGEEPVGIVVTDGVMPGMDGFELARQIMQWDPSVPVILVSGYLSHFVCRSDIPENVEAFFSKPFLGSELVAKVVDLAGVLA